LSTKKHQKKEKSVQPVPIAFTTATNGIRRMVAPVEEKKGQQKKNLVQPVPIAFTNAMNGISKW
jgi:hypothetical protein